MFPFAVFPPLRVPSRADPSGLGHAATIYSSVQGPPGVETPTSTLAKASLSSTFSRALDKEVCRVPGSTRQRKVVVTATR
jgi:hypothetical protein